MELWYREHGFYNNPFSIKPAMFTDELFGYDLDIILDKISRGEVLFIEGEYGKGKTTILKRIIREFGGGRNLIYYSCNRTEDNINFNEILRGRYGFLGSLFNIKGKNMTLFLDEVQYLDEEDSGRLVELYPNNFKSIVLVAPDYSKTKFTNGVKNLINKNIMKLGKITDKDAIKIVRKRIGEINLLNDNIIKLIFSKSDNNPRKLLQNCEKVCRHAYEMGEKEVNEKHVKEVLS